MRHDEEPDDAMSLPAAVMCVLLLPTFIVVAVLFSLEGTYDTLAGLLPQVEGARCEEPTTARKVAPCGPNFLRGLQVAVSTGGGLMALALPRLARRQLRSLLRRVAVRLVSGGAAVLFAAWTVTLLADGLESGRFGGYHEFATQLAILGVVIAAVGLMLLPWRASGTQQPGPR